MAVWIGCWFGSWASAEERRRLRAGLATIWLPWAWALSVLVIPMRRESGLHLGPTPSGRRFRPWYPGPGRARQFTMGRPRFGRCGRLHTGGADWQAGRPPLTSPLAGADAICAGRLPAACSVPDILSRGMAPVGVSRRPRIHPGNCGGMINAPVRVSLIQLSVPSAGYATPFTVTTHRVLATRSV